METTANTKLDFLSGGGKMGELIRAKDWSKTPLGEPQTWPQSLRTTVSLCIASNFPIAISWGVHRTQIYNDGYLPITGDMHPTSLGQDFKECWLSAWPVIGQAFEEASLGETRFLENQQILLDRYGYKEETFFTFSFSPILDETGSVGGLFHPVVEMTQQILAERRLTILRVVADSTLNAKTVKEASALILDCLKDFELDLPFALLYGMPTDAKEAQLQGSCGVETHSPLAPVISNIEEQSLKSWPIAEAIKTGKGVQVEDVAEIFGIVNCGPYPEPPTQALVYPITIPSAAHTNYFLVVGVSSRRRLDEKYLSFYELLSASVTNALIRATAYEEERKKAEALAEIDKAKTVFFSNISHEFRTPLTLMLSPLEELLNQQNSHFSESEKNNIETSHRNAMRLLKLVNTLLDFSSIEAGRQQAVFSLVDIVPLTKNLSANFRSVIEKAGLQLIVKADSFIQHVYVDQQMWEKIIFNLLSNAFKYTLEGKITVELTAEIDYAVLKIIDTGIGIPEDELPKMFERFHRVQNTSGRTFEGTGIGLSLIKELVHMHKGVIEVESNVNDGSTFTVKIPFGKEHIKSSQISKKEHMSDQISSNVYVDEIESILKAEKNLTSNLLNENSGSDLPIILVVDDNADMREHMRSVLSTNYNVITANNGLDALHKLKETIPTLVLSDVMMPVMDGIGLLRELKNNQATSSIPVILLTARAGEESKIEGLETGADDYLVKPFLAKELLARVKAQIKIVKLRQSLEGKVRNLFMEAPAIICVLKGPQHVFELANEMYLQLIGKRDVLEKTVREVMPELEGQGYFDFLDNVYATGEPYTGNETPAQIDKGNGKLEEAYFNFVYQPTHNSEGKVDGILMHGIDVTEQVLARKKIEENKNQLQNIFLNAPAAIAIFEGSEHKYILANKAYEKLSNRKAADLLGKNMQDLFPELKGSVTLELFDNVLETGESFSAPEYALMLDLKNEGVLRQYYFNFSMEPLKNNSGEIYAVIAITYDITEQVEARKKNEETEKQQVFLLKFSDTLRAEKNADAVAYRALQMLFEHLKLDRCYVGVYQLAHDRGEFPYQVGNDLVPPMPDGVRLSDFPDALRIAFDRTLVINDIASAEGLTDTDKQNLSALHLCALVAATLRRGEAKPLWSIVAVSASSRHWTLPEIKLIEEVTERTWMAIERAKAEEALQQSEEKYRMLFNSMDEGFCTLQVLFDDAGKAIDCLYLEVNSAFVPQTGLENVVGKTMLEVNSETEEFWIETYGRISRTGEAERFEHVVSGLQKFYEFYAFRFGESGENRVAVIFNDITKRKNEEYRQTYILKLSDAIKELVDPEDIQLTACRILGEHAKVNRVLYGEVIDEEQIIIHNNYINGVDPINAILDAEQYGRNVIDSFKRNEKIIISDITTDPEYTEEEKQRFLSFDVVANAGMGLLKGGRWVATFGMHCNTPRKWTATEIWLLEETAERTWAAVERARAEQALRKSEEKYRSLFTSIDQGFLLCELVRDKEGRGIDYYMLELNPTYEKQTGLSIDMVLGKTILQVFPAMDTWLIDTFAAVVDNQRPDVFEYHFEFSQRWHEIKVYPSEKDKFAVLFSDITERKQAEEKIKESESRFRTMADASPVLIWTIDANGLSSYYNKTFLDFIGMSKNEDISDWEKIVHPEDVQFALVAINTAIAKRCSYSLECRLLRADGQWRWVLAQGNPSVSPNNEFSGFVGSSVDITERKQAEEKIKESEARYKSLIFAAPIGIGVFIGRDLVMESANQPLIDIIGKGTNIVGKRLTEIMPELIGQGQPYLKILDNVFTSGKMYQSLADPVTILRDGIIHYEFYDINYVPLFDGEGNVYAILNIATDVTAQTQFNKKIKASEEEFRNVLLQSPGLFVILKGPEMVIDFVNESVLHSWGRTTDIVGKTILEALPEIKDQAFPRLLAEVYKTGENCFGKEEKAVIIKDGEPGDMYYNYVYQPIFQEDKTISGITIMAIDITEQVITRKKIEENEKLLEQKILQRTEQLNEKNSELQKMNKELEAFTYISSHDLQEPLRKIQTFAGRIISHEKEQLSETARDYFDKMNNAANRMRILIQDLLAFSRLSTSERKFENTHLHTIIEDIKEELAEKNAIIISEEICEVNIIPFQFRQLMYNLVSNAIKFTKPDVVPCIVIKCSTGKGSEMNNKKLFPDKEYCYITISDNGIGFNNEYSEKIFEVFQKLHSKDQYAGTGIGLAIVKKIVDNHNGFITAEGELGKGTTFYIYIPN